MIEVLHACLHAVACDLCQALKGEKQHTKEALWGSVRQREKLRSVFRSNSVA